MHFVHPFVSFALALGATLGLGGTGTSKDAVPPACLQPTQKQQ